MSMVRTTLVWLAALAIAVAPLMPVAASMARGTVAGDGAHAAHASSDAVPNAAVLSDAAADMSANHADCTKHDVCDGKCCNACAHCVAVTVVFHADSHPLHSVQTPVIPRLHARLAVALPNRPPQHSAG
ncbi:MAG: hypothetical protein HY942_04310 [Gammaproteobacteria bacterium]|nr:hypothetical protein [Gammaproteobacteria bacterium]